MKMIEWLCIIELTIINFFTKSKCQNCGKEKRFRKKNLFDVLFNFETGETKFLCIDCINEEIKRVN